LFTPGGRVDVEGSWDEGEDFVTIAVADTGVGISEKHQKTIFEAFGQTGTFYTAGQTGTGLGLSICRRLATILGGDMTLESEEGEGARFTLELPRRSEET
jgi:signal transduction histidine kinase